MKVAVRYASRGGNTKALAEVIAKHFGVKALRVSEPITEEVDLLFLGGSVLFNGATKDMKEFLTTLDKNLVKQIAAFSTSEFSQATIKKIETVAGQKGITVSPQHLLLKVGYQGFSLFAPAGGDLKPEQVQAGETFAASFDEK